MWIHVLLLLVSCPAEEPVLEECSFPFEIVAESADRVDLLPNPGEIERLRHLDRAVWQGVPLPGRGAVSLRLERVSTASVEPVVFVDGEPTNERRSGTSVFGGTIAGEPGSDVVIGLSQHGCWGWVRSRDTMTLLESRPDPSAGWLAPRIRLVTAESEVTGATFLCGVAPLAGAPPQAPLGGSTGGGAGLGQGGKERLRVETPKPLLEATVAFETDWQFYQLFGDLDAARAYVDTLFGALNLRYREHIGIVLTPVYLGFWTVPEDPWEGTDNGFSACQFLPEFRRKWAGGRAPVAADLYHLFSGAPRLGGCAYIDTLCDPQRAFGVTLHAEGLYSPPVEPGPNTHDFVILAHEMGHTFGAIHTHDFCPPLDECAEPSAFGPCQQQMRCKVGGTIMSYCVGCPGGFLNMNTHFHPSVARLMRERSEAKCLEAFEGVLMQDLGFGLAGSRGVPGLEAEYIDDPAGDRLELQVTGAPSRRVGLMVGSLRASFQSFLGGTLVPRADLLVPILTDADGSVTAPRPVAGRYPDGLTLYVQAWFLDLGAEGGFAATPGLRLELFR